MANKTIVDLETDLVKPYIDTKAITIEKNLAPTENGATAVGSYAIGEQFVRGDKLYKAKTAITAGDTLTLNTNYEAADDITTQVTSLKEDFISHVNSNGSKNILPNICNGSVDGMTYSHNSSGELIISGTSTNNPASVSLLHSSQINLGGDCAVKIEDIGIDKTKEYVFKTFNAYSDNLRLYMELLDSNKSVISGTQIDLNGSSGYTEANIDFSQYSTAVYIKCGYKIANSATVPSNTIAKPMLCLASDYALDPSYQPYAKTNRQLTRDKVGMDLLSEVGAVNYIPITLISQSDSYFSYTVNADKSFKINGSNTSGNTYTKEIGRAYFKAGTYHITGGGGDVLLQLANTSWEGLSGRDFIYTVPSDQTMILYVRLNAGKSCSNFLVKPMITPVEYNGDYVPYAKTNRELTEETDVTLTPDTSNFSIVSYKIKKRDGHVYGYIDAKVVNTQGISVGTLSEKPPYAWAQSACNSVHRVADNTPTVCYVNNQGVIAINPASAFTVDDRIQIAIDFYTSL